MSSIDKTFLFPEAYENPSLSLGLLHAISVNGELTAKAVKAGNLSLLDPIVHDDSCLIRALAVIEIANHETIAEAEKITEQSKKVLRAISKKKNWLQGTLSAETIECQGLALKVSDAWIFLQLAHLLTVAKTFFVNASGQEVSKIDLNNLLSKLRAKNLVQLDQLGKLVDHCQRKLSELSTAYIQQKALELVMR